MVRSARAILVRSAARRSARMAVFTASMAAARVSLAQSNPRVQLQYEREPGTESCPGEDELRSAVAARLGYDPFSPSAKRTVVVRLARRPRELAGRVEVRDDQGVITGTRDLTSPTRDCRELIAALSVAAAIGIDPVHGMTGTPAPKTVPAEIPYDESAAVHDSSVSPVSVPVSEAREPTVPREQVHVRGSIGALVAAGAAPAPAIGFLLGIGVRRGPLSIGVDGRADLPSSTGVTGGSVSASLLLVSLVPCLHYKIMSACALGGIGAFRADGQGVTDPQHVAKPYGAVGGRLAIELPVGSVLAFRVHADLLATLSQTTLRLDNHDVWTTPPLSGAGGLSLVGTL